MKFNNLQEIADYLYESSNDSKTYTVVNDIVQELLEIAHIPEVYARCDEYLDLDITINKNLLNQNINSIKSEDYEEDISLIIDAAESLISIIDK